MNAMSMVGQRPLMELLGARWRVRARCAAIAWDAAAGLAAFGLSDGSLAVAKLAWDGGPTVRPREGGGAELVPPSAPPPPVARIPVHDGACLALAADPDGGFLSGGEDGQLARVQADGVIDTLARFGAVPVAAVATGRGGWRVCGAGPVLMRLGGGSATTDVPDAIAALCVAPDGSRVAIAHAHGVALWAGGAAPRVLSSGGNHVVLAWSADASRLASSTRDGDVFLWDVAGGEARQIDQGRSMRRALAFTADGAWLVTGGSGAVACWNLATCELEPCGIGSKNTVLHVACHPTRVLIAAGYANGAILVARPGSREVVFIRDAAGSAIDALSWSPDGEALAFGTSGGEIGLARLPPLLFRDEKVSVP
jgi:WD40 repeat protein